MKTKEDKRAYHASYRAANREKLRTQSASYYARHPKKANASSRRSQIRREYGITHEEYTDLLARPCAICGSPSECLDHDHVTDKIREALCQGCNIALGSAKDDPQRLRDAADYLERHQC